MPPALISTIIGVIPELLQFIKGFHTANGQLPTDAQVIANFQTDAARVTAVADAWLAAHPVVPTTNQGT